MERFNFQSDNSQNVPRSTFIKMLALITIKLIMYTLEVSKNSMGAMEEAMMGHLVFSMETLKAQ